LKVMFLSLSETLSLASTEPPLWSAVITLQKTI
jgi:hypothetical protein